MLLSEQTKFWGNICSMNKDKRGRKRETGNTKRRKQRRGVRTEKMVGRTKDRNQREGEGDGRRGPSSSEGVFPWYLVWFGDHES